MMQAVMKAERSLFIAADQQRVWDAITKPEQFGAWFGIEASWDRLEAGAPMTMNFVEHNIIEHAIMDIVQPMDRFSFRWTADPDSDSRTLVTFLLKSVAGGTHVTVSEAGFEALPAAVRQQRMELNDDGWRQQLDNLSAHVLKK